MKIGDRVKYSGYVINSARKRWNNAGDRARKNDAEYDLEYKIKARGIIVDIKSNTSCKQILVIRWDDDYLSETMPYMVEEE